MPTVVWRFEKLAVLKYAGEVMPREPMVLLDMISWSGTRGRLKVHTLRGFWLVFYCSCLCWALLLDHLSFVDSAAIGPVGTAGSVDNTLKLSDIGSLRAPLFDATLLVCPACRSRVSRSRPLVGCTAKATIGLW